MGGAHQLWLDASSARFWKGAAHHALRTTYDILASGIALALTAFAFAGPAVAMAIDRSDAAAGPQTTDAVRAVSEVTVRSNDGDIVVDAHPRG